MNTAGFIKKFNVDGINANLVRIARVAATVEDDSALREKADVLLAADKSKQLALSGFQAELIRIDFPTFE